ncbi:PREDICTED: growth factor receptor-bound protein 7-like, partial [Dinoponera quadriceps]|uniref:Growth factor receptor-bound protein 7-like n=1 Tax=Dinoponera quadriceps TaxID=609295 RepID=A0A6P3Y3R9_DINQU
VERGSGIYRGGARRPSLPVPTNAPDEIADHGGSERHEEREPGRTHGWIDREKERECIIEELIRSNEDCDITPSREEERRGASCSRRVYCVVYVCRYVRSSGSTQRPEGPWKTARWRLARRLRRFPAETKRKTVREEATHAGRRSRGLRGLRLDNEQLITLVHLTDYNVYRIPNAKRCFGAPFAWGACLRPNSNAEAEDTEAGEPGLKVIAFDSEKSRACWLTAMRLAKYGKQLRENYRAFKNKQCEQNSSGSPKEQYSSYNVSNESVRSRVAMDFTGSVGRIVEDPKEAKDIAENEGIIWRRRWRPFSRTPPGCAMVRLHGLDGGIHVLQPWFHGGLKREIAAAIIRDHGSVDGVFLVRESKSNPGAYVLTYKYSDKVFHAQIQPVFDERRNCLLYTLDKGATKFYDLLQLIEFYQLNAGSLPTRLTHYVQNGVPPPMPRPEDGGASPSPPEGSQRFSDKAECGGNPASI